MTFWLGGPGRMIPGFRSGTGDVLQVPRHGRYSDMSQPVDLLLNSNWSVATALSPLVVSGQFLAQANAQPWTAIEASDFNLFARYDMKAGLRSGPWFSSA